MNITMKFYTAQHFTQEQRDSMVQRIMMVSVKPVGFYYNGTKLSIDILNLQVTPQHYGLDVTLKSVLEFPEIPEGHGVFLQARVSYGEPTDVRHIGSFDVVIAKLTPEIRFHEFLTTGKYPHPHYSDIGSVMRSVVEIAEMHGYKDYGFDFVNGKYSIYLDEQHCGSDSNLENLHKALLSEFADSTKEKQ